MYRYIKGNIEKIGEDYIILDNNGIGYKVSTSRNSIIGIGSDIRDRVIYTHLHVREDELSLYGFITDEELKVFELLISVSKIGPKVGLGIVSTLYPQEILLAIATEDIKALSKSPGVGNKTARRMVLELKDKIDGNICLDKDLTNIGKTNDLDEAINALITLGYSKIEVNSVITKIDVSTLNTEDIIKIALKELSK